MRLDEFLLEQGIEDLRKFEDPDKPVRPFDEYEYMISLLNFVFADIPLERLTPRDRECLSEEEFHKYFDIGVLKYKCVLSKMNGDMRKCALLFFYLVLMWIEGHYADISENMEAIKKQLASFSYALPDYSYDYKWVKVSQKEIEKIKKEIETEKACTDVEKRGKRKPNDNRRDKLNALYEKIFLKRAEKVSASDRRKGFTPYIDDKEAWVIRLLLKHKQGKRETDLLQSYGKLVVRTLVKRDCSDLDKKAKEQNARNKLTEILQSEFFCNSTSKVTDICNKYIKKKNEIYELYCNYYLGAESVFDHLSSDEVILWNYLHRLHKKYTEIYANKKNADHYDISLKKNRCAWGILTKEERKTLAELVMNLDDSQWTFLKYIRAGSVFDVMRERIFYSLIADISGNPYYITSRKVEQIAYMIQHASDWDVPSDLQTHKLYESLIEKIKKADEICVKIERIINEKLRNEYEQNVEKALKEQKKKTNKND